MKLGSGKIPALPAVSQASVVGDLPCMRWDTEVVIFRRTIFRGRRKHPSKLKAYSQDPTREGRSAVSPSSRSNSSRTSFQRIRPLCLCFIDKPEAASGKSCLVAVQVSLPVDAASSGLCKPEQLVPALPPGSAGGPVRWLEPGTHHQGPKASSALVISSQAHLCLCSF